MNLGIISSLVTLGATRDHVVSDGFCMIPLSVPGSLTMGVPVQLKLDIKITFSPRLCSRLDDIEDEVISAMPK